MSKTFLWQSECNFVLKHLERQKDILAPLKHFKSSTCTMYPFSYIAFRDIVMFDWRRQILCLLGGFHTWSNSLTLPVLWGWLSWSFSATMVSSEVLLELYSVLVELIDKTKPLPRLHFDIISLTQLHRVYRGGVHTQLKKKRRRERVVRINTVTIQYTAICNFSNTDNFFGKYDWRHLHN